MCNHSFVKALCSNCGKVLMEIKHGEVIKKCDKCGTVNEIKIECNVLTLFSSAPTAIRQG